MARDEEYFQQLTAEKMVTRYIKGQPVREWVKPDRARNEALDCRVYAYAALKIMQPSIRRTAERLGLNTVTAKPVRYYQDVKAKDEEVKEEDDVVQSVLAALKRKPAVKAEAVEIDKPAKRRQLGKSVSKWFMLNIP